MSKVKALIGKEKYRVEITSPSGNSLFADEPVAVGGKNAGFSPKELLVSSLAACTSITLKMYAEHKGWDLELVNVEIDLEYNKDKNESLIRRNIRVTGQLDHEQKESLLKVANKCPLHKILTGSIHIDTDLT